MKVLNFFRVALCALAVAFACSCQETKEAVMALKDGDVVLLENTRKYEEEEANDPEFAKELASMCDVYVNDAFGTAHRKHASTYGVAMLKPNAIGFLIEKELDALMKAGDTGKGETEQAEELRKTLQEALSYEEDVATMLEANDAIISIEMYGLFSLDVGYGIALEDGAALWCCHLGEATSKTGIDGLHLSPARGDVAEEFASLVGTSHIGC